MSKIMILKEMANVFNDIIDELVNNNIQLKNNFEVIGNVDVDQQQHILEDGVMGLTFIQKETIITVFSLRNISNFVCFLNERGRKEFFERLIRHEMRHVFQCDYLISHGCDIVGVGKRASANGYENDPMEKDARKFEVLTKPLADINKGLEFIDLI